MMHSPVPSILAINAVAASLLPAEIMLMMRSYTSLSRQPTTCRRLIVPEPLCDSAGLASAIVIMIGRAILIGDTYRH